MCSEIEQVLRARGWKPRSARQTAAGRRVTKSTNRS
jgi:hypothetical protein